ncbi:MAG: hypothetical protein ACXAC5_02115 [Promethearchaeota archaeon]|jgi:hypothetical protein
MIGRRLLEIVVVLFLLWFCFSLKFFLGLAAGFVVAGEIGYSAWKKPSS